MIDNKYLLSGLFAVVSNDFGLKADFEKIATEIPLLFDVTNNKSTTVLPIPNTEKNIPGLIIQFDDEKGNNRGIQLSRTRLDVNFSFDVSKQGYQDTSLGTGGKDFFVNNIKHKLISIYEIFKTKYTTHIDRYGMVHNYIFRDEGIANQNDYMNNYLQEIYNDIEYNEGNITIKFDDRRKLQIGGVDKIMTYQKILISNFVLFDEKVWNQATLDLNFQFEANKSEIISDLNGFFDLYLQQVDNFLDTL